jgi:hypothetical protein
MGQNQFLVGNVPLRTVADVKTTFGGVLGPCLHAIPTGKIGKRRSWALCLASLN